MDRFVTSSRNTSAAETGPPYEAIVLISALFNNNKQQKTEFKTRLIFTVNCEAE